MNKENTFRALKGEEMFVDSLRCRFGWHRWTKWGEIKRSKGGMFAEQHRSCVDCGQIAIRKVNSNV